MEYKIVRSKRKTVAIEIKRDLSITVRAPMHTSYDIIDGFVSNHEQWINKTIIKLKGKQTNIESIDSEELKVLKIRAAEYIPLRVNYYSRLMGLKPSAVKINSAKTRFGSCSSKNSLNFSCRVMKYPDYIVDYVIVHELAHIKHHNHSKSFYSLIEKYMSDYKERIKYLKEN